MKSAQTRDLERQLAQSRRQDRKGQPKRIQHKRTQPAADGQRKPRQVFKDHKGFVAGLFCIATKIRTGAEVYGVQVAHQRFSDAGAGVLNPGMGRKSSDDRVLPLTPAEHHRQHARGDELAYWDELGLTAQEVTALGRALKGISGDRDQAEHLLRSYADIARSRRRAPSTPIQEP